MNIDNYLQRISKVHFYLLQQKVHILHGAAFLGFYDLIKSWETKAGLYRWIIYLSMNDVMTFCISISVWKGL